jgi:hypothetical protein
MSDTDFDARLVAEWQDTSRSAVVPSPSEVMARGGPDHASRTAVIAELEEVRVLVEEVVESLDADRAMRLATRLWTVLDVLAHVASWAHQTRVEVERLLSDQSFDEIIHFGVNGPHVWNQREVDARRGHTPAQLLAEIDVEHEQLIELMVGITEQEMRRVVDLPRTIGELRTPWRMPLSAMIVMTCWHARGHLRGVKEMIS